VVLAPLGSTGVRVSRVSLGVYGLTGMYGGVPRRVAVETIRAAVELGVTLDTAAVYGGGLGEDLVREALGGLSGGAVVVTKIGYEPGSRPPRQDFSRRFLLGEAERSCWRLGRCPDVVLLHNPPLEVLRGGEVWGALEDIVSRGLALAAGVALGPETDVLPHALEALRHSQTGAVQFVLNALEVEPGATIARLAKARGAGTMARVPMAGGVLDGTHKPGAPAPGDHRRLRRGGWYEWAHRLYGRIRPLLSLLPGTPAQRAIRLALDLAPVDTVVTVARSPRELEEHVEAASLPPTPPSVIEEIVRAYMEEVPRSPEAPKASLELLARLAPTLRAPRVKPSNTSGSPAGVSAGRGLRRHRPGGVQG